MEYTQLEEAYKYEVIAEAIYAREMEHFHYDFDKKNFEYILETLPEGEYKEEIRGRIKSSLEQKENVETIYTALQTQIDDQEAYAKAVITVTARRLEDKNNEVCPRSK